MDVGESKDIPIDTREVRAVKITLDIELDNGGFIRQIYMGNWLPIRTTIRRVATRKGVPGRMEITIPRMPTIEQSHPGRNSKTETIAVNPDLL